MPDDKAQENFTDPQSRIMKTSDGFQQGYSAQAAVDDGSQLIVATELTNCAADTPALLPTIDATRRNTGGVPEMTLADSEDNFAALEAERLAACVALAREGKKIRPIDPVQHPATQRMAERLTTPDGQRAHHNNLQ